MHICRTPSGVSSTAEELKRLYAFSYMLCFYDMEKPGTFGAASRILRDVCKTHVTGTNHTWSAIYNLSRIMQWITSRPGFQVLRIDERVLFLIAP
jgi:hypothetical protein